MSKAANHPGSVEALRAMTLTQSYTLGRPNSFKFSADGRTLFFLRSPPREAAAKLWALDVGTKQESLLVDPEALQADGPISAEEKARRERLRIRSAGLTGYHVLGDGRFILCAYGRRLWLHDRKQKLTRPLGIDSKLGSPMAVRPSPDGEHISFVAGANLWVANMDLGRPSKRWKKSSLDVKLKRLTDDGHGRLQYGLPEFVAQEEMGRFFGSWWSPDGKWIAFQATDTSAMDRFTLADPSRPDQKPRLVPYPKAGSANADVRLFVVKHRGSKRKEITWDREAFPYLARVTWSPGAPLCLLVQKRDQKTQQYLRADIRKGSTRLMFEEHDKAWLNLSDTTPRWAPDGKSYLWATEQDGAWSLERHWPRLGDKKDGLRRLETVLAPEHSFSKLLRYEARSGRLWFLASPNPSTDELWSQTPGEEPKRWTEAEGEHTATVSPRGDLVVVTHKSFGSWPRSALCDVETRAEVTVMKSVAESPTTPPKIEALLPEQTGGFHAFVVRPQFATQGTLPVILYVYGGPHHLVVRSDACRYLLPQWLANQGFIVVGLDGRGTPGRGRAFERAIEGRLAEVPLQDQVKGLQHILRGLDDADPKRVGIYGWSFGGYMAALAVLERPDVFKAAVAGAPVTDWSWYDTHYTERYLGHPKLATKAYKAASLLPRAKKLSRSLLLIHGLVDDNVYFTHSLQLSQALFSAKKDFQLLALPGLTHQVADPEAREALYSRIVRFFRTELT